MARAQLTLLMQEGSGTARVRPVKVVPAGDPQRAYDAAAQRGVVGTLPAASQRLLEEWAEKLGAATALLSRGESGWRFEGEGFPRRESHRAHGSSAADQEQAWTGIAVGTIDGRDWLLILPGSTERWHNAPGLETFIGQFRATLENPHPADDAQLAIVQRRFYAFSRRLAAKSGPEAHAYILSTIAPLISARMGSFASFNESEAMLSITATHGYPSAVVDHVHIAPGSGVLGQVFSTRRAILGRAHREGKRRLRYLTDSFIAVPLVSHGGALGVISFADKIGATAFDRRDRAIVRMFAAPAALAVANDRVSEMLTSVSQQAILDPVTGLFNRRHLETLLESEVQRARRQQLDLALLMIDVDDFKRINDSFGHPEGDRLLHSIAEALRSTIRIFDLCARYGGEEFAIIMPGASIEMAAQVGERVRQSVESRAGKGRLAVTVSVGAAVLKPGDGANDLVASADRALIAAKRAGKNNVRTDPGEYA